MKPRKWIAVVLSILFLGVGLTGCSQKKATTAAPAVTPNKSQVVTTTMYSKKLNMDGNYDGYLAAGYNPKSRSTVAIRR